MPQTCPNHLQTPIRQVRWPPGDSTWSSIWSGTRLYSILIRHQNTAAKSFNWIETSEGLKNDQEHSRRRRKKWRTSVMAGKEVISSPKFQNNLWQTQLYYIFILSIILLARTSVEVPGALQKLLKFWTPLHVYKKCPCPPRQAGISCFTSSFPSQYQSEASSLLPSQSSPLSLNLSSLKLSYWTPLVSL